MPASPLLLDALSFGAAALDLVSDATSVLNCAYGLAGNFGRYGAINSNPAITTETQALAAATTARASVADAAVALADAVRSGGDVPLAAQAVLDALTLALASPADQVRVCTSLATRQGSGPVAVLCRRLAVIALAQAAANYDPTSYNDAQATLLMVTDALDAADRLLFRQIDALRGLVSNMSGSWSASCPCWLPRQGSIWPSSHWTRSPICTRDASRRRRHEGLSLA